MREESCLHALAPAPAAIVLALLVTACGGGIGSEDGATTGGGTTGGVAAHLAMGTLNPDGSFTAGAIAVGVSPLAAGGSASLRVDIVDLDNADAPYTAAPVSVAFASACASRNLSTIASPQDTRNGSASSTYVAQGCSGDDAITASATVDGSALSATGSIEVLAAALNSIQFISAAPNVIGLRGSGIVETSTLTFVVLNSSGGPIPDQAVDFALSSTSGGLSLTPASGITGVDGRVQTIVRAGTVPGAVSVVASALGTDGVTRIQTGSDGLAVGTGIPTNDAFSVAVGCFNVEGLNRDGETTSITVRAADRFGNPVIDGTPVSFEVDEGGSVTTSCLTSKGSCAVDWTSQDPRPNQNFGSADNGPRNGRASVLVSAVGEESFRDLNRNGSYDCTGIDLGDADQASFVAQGYTFGNCPAGEPFRDLPEAFHDDNENHSRDSFEEFADFDASGSYTPANGLFSGVLCNGGSAACDSARRLNVRRNVTLIMSGSAPLFDFTPGSGDVAIGGGSFDGGTFAVPAGAMATIAFVVRDANHEPMPGGTTVALAGSGAASITGSASFPVPCQTDDSAAGNTFRFSVKAADAQTPPKDASGTLELKVTSPRGLISTYAFSFVSKAS